MRPLSIREPPPPRPGSTGDPSAGSGSGEGRKRGYYRWSRWLAAGLGQTNTPPFLSPALLLYSYLCYCDPVVELVVFLCAVQVPCLERSPVLKCCVSCSVQSFSTPSTPKRLRSLPVSSSLWWPSSTPRHPSFFCMKLSLTSPVFLCRISVCLYRLLSRSRKQMRQISGVWTAWTLITYLLKLWMSYEAGTKWSKVSADKSHFMIYFVPFANT